MTVPAIQFRLKDLHHGALSVAAEARGVSVNQLAKEIVVAWLEDEQVESGMAMKVVEGKPRKKGKPAGPVEVPKGGWSSDTVWPEPDPEEVVELPTTLAEKKRKKGSHFG